MVDSYRRLEPMATRSGFMANLLALRRYQHLHTTCRTTGQNVLTEDRDHRPYRRPPRKATLDVDDIHRHHRATTHERG